MIYDIYSICMCCADRIHGNVLVLMLMCWIRGFLDRMTGSLKI